LSLLGSEFVDLVLAVLLGDTADSHLTSLSAGDHLVGSDLVVVAAVTLGFAHSGALAGLLDDHFGGLGLGDTVVPVLLSLSGAAGDFGVSASLGADEALVAVAVVVTISLASTEVPATDVVSVQNILLGGLDDFVATSVSSSLSTDFTAAVSASTKVASAGVVVLSFSMESLHSELSASDDSESGSLLSGGLLTRKSGSLSFSGLSLSDSNGLSFGSFRLSDSDGLSFGGGDLGLGSGQLSSGFLSGSFVSGGLFGKLDGEGFGCGDLGPGISLLLKMSHSSSSFSDSSPVSEAGSAVPDVHVSTVVVLGNVSMENIVKAICAVNLILSVAVIVVVDGNPRVFLVCRSVIPFGLVVAGSLA